MLTKTFHALTVNFYQPSELHGIIIVTIIIIIIIIIISALPSGTLRIREVKSHN